MTITANRDKTFVRSQKNDTCSKLQLHFFGRHTRLWTTIQTQKKKEQREHTISHSLEPELDYTYGAQNLLRPLLRGLQISHRAFQPIQEVLLKLLHGSMEIQRYDQARLFQQLIAQAIGVNEDTAEVAQFPKMVQDYHPCTYHRSWKRKVQNMRN